MTALPRFGLNRFDARSVHYAVVAEPPAGERTATSE